MELETSYTPATDILAAAHKRWDAKLARIISYIFSPTVFSILGVLLAAAYMGAASAWRWALFYVGSGVMLPILYTIWKVRTGEISDYHMERREERIRPMIVFMLLAAVSTAILYVGGAPLPLLVFASIGLVQVGVMLLITLKWKISGHSTAAASFAIFVYALFGGWTIITLGLIPLVAWARVHLSRHELSQTLAGTVLGIIFITISLYLAHLGGFPLAI